MSRRFAPVLCISLPYEPLPSFIPLLNNYLLSVNVPSKGGRTLSRLISCGNVLQRTCSGCELLKICAVVINRSTVAVRAL